MENVKFKTESGVEVELTPSDMYNIAFHYMWNSLMKQVREEHEDWTDVMVKEIAEEATVQIIDCEECCGEAINWAISYVEENFEELIETSEAWSKEFFEDFVRVYLEEE